MLLKGQVSEQEQNRTKTGKTKYFVSAISDDFFYRECIGGGRGIIDNWSPIAIIEPCILHPNKNWSKTFLQYKHQRDQTFFSIKFTYFAIDISKVRFMSLYNL